MSNIDYAFEVHKLLNRKKVTIACIIPALNEGPRISKVLDVVINFPVFDEIILVNDASTDNTLSLMEYYALRSKKVRVINRKVNSGKTNAVLDGIRHVTSELVCLVDADVTGLKYDYLYKMIYFVLVKEFDMTILDRAGDRMGPIGWSQSWVVRFIGGERTFWLKDFKQIKFGKLSRYAIEQEMNLHYIKNRLKVRTIYCSELKGEYQWNKKGLINALKSYAKMIKEIYTQSKVNSFYYEVENIVEDRIEPLYDLLEKSPTHARKPVTGVILAVGLLTSIATFAWLNIRERAKRKE